MADEKQERGYGNPDARLPAEYYKIPPPGSRAPDKYDAMYKQRVTAGKVPGDAELRRQKRTSP